MKRRAVMRGLAALTVAAGVGGVAARWRAATAVRDAEAASPPLGEFVDVAGTRLHLVDRGPPDAPAVILIHGASGNLRDFTFSFLDRLTDRWRVIAIDRPGFGYSDRGPGDAHHPSAQARLMRAAVAARGVRRSVVVGHSLGCASALAWALDAPESVVGVVDVAGVAMPWPGSAGYLYETTAPPVIGHVVSTVIAAGVSPSYAAGAIEGIFRPQTAPAGYAEAIGAGLALRPATLRNNGRDIAWLKPLLRIQSQRYGALPPVEIVHGAADAVVPASVHAEPLAARAPDARLTLLDGIGHMPHHVAPDTVIAAVERLIARQA